MSDMSSATTTGNLSLAELLAQRDAVLALHHKTELWNGWADSLGELRAYRSDGETNEYVENICPECSQSDYYYAVQWPCRTARALGITE